MAAAVHIFSRRGVLAGMGISAALAQTKAAFWNAEYTAKKGALSLAMYRKRTAAPKTGEKPLPVLFLVHGSSLSGKSTFDLAVPGKEEYSLMNVFARYGFDVWTMDHENYGKSSRTPGNSDIASGVEDLKAGIELVVRETGRQKVHLFGESSGGLRAGGYAMARPDRVDRLVLAAFTYKGEGSPTLAERAKQLDYYSSHNMRPTGSRDDPQYLHARQGGHIRSIGRRSAGRRGTEIRRSGSNRHLSGHDGESAGGGSEESAWTCAVAARRV